MLLESLREGFAIERFGDLTTERLRVLVYLGTTKRGDRQSSAERLAKELGLGSENTVTDAFSVLFHRKGFVRLSTVNLPERDANSYELTKSGKRALGHLLNAVGFLDLALMSTLTILLGALLGSMYVVYIEYPSYLAAILTLTVTVAAVLLAYLANLIRLSKQRRRELVSAMLQKPA